MCGASWSEKDPLSLRTDPEGGGVREVLRTIVSFVADMSDLPKRLLHAK